MEGSMKRILAAAAVAAPLALVPGIAQATGGTGSTGGSSSVTINQYADYEAVGLVLDVGLNVRCSGGVNGLVDVTVEQSPPETPYPVAFGSGPQSVVCDGKTRAAAVTIVGEGFDAGKAKATAILTVPLKSSATTTKWITIVPG
jgi:hypothetical protein